MLSHQFQEAVRRVRSRLTLPGRVERPILIILSGLPGTGKSTLAHNLAEALPALVVSSDFVRKSLIAHPTHSAAENRFVHAVARANMRYFLKAGYSVIADATNLAEIHRQILLTLAETVCVPALVVRTVAPAEVVMDRLLERFEHRSPYDLSDADWQVYLLLSRIDEPIGVPHFCIDTTKAVEGAVELLLAAARNAHSSPRRET